MQVGDRVEVFVTFTGAWSRGFEVAAVRDDGYSIRRCSDGAMLPAPTSPSDVRPIGHFAAKQP